MATVPKQSAAEVPPSKPEAGKIPDIGAASVPETLAALRVNPDTGLTRAEVDARRKEHGYNEVAETKEHPLLRFLSKFWGLSAWMLELIMVLSAVLHKFSDLAVVSALLIVNAVLSFAQERRAAGVVETLRKRLQVSARVRRDASWQVIPARELVPGDIVRVRPGDIIPADTKLLTGELSVDQSALTGESKDAHKAPGDVLSSGSVVRRGEGNGVVMLTGAQTYFGRTTELVQKARPKLHIEAVVAKVVRWLFVIVGSLLSVVVVLSLMRGTPLIEMVSLLLVLLMSAVPVALPVMFTVSMAVGAAELAKRGVLVTRLSAAEDAATMDVLCVDKTGTITMNQLAVTGVIPLGTSKDSDVLFAGALASEEANQDPIDLAFLAAARERHIFDGLPAVTPVSFKPFDAQNRRTEAVVEQNGQRFRVMKGAVRTIAETCGLKPPEIEALEARVSESAAKGYRTLAVARGPETGAPGLVGLVTLYDPPRPDAKQLIAELRGLGVAVKMLTGDALPVAREIAQGVGLPNILRVADLKATNAKAGNEARRSPGWSRWVCRGLSGRQIHRGAASAGRRTRDRDDRRRRQRCARLAPGRSRNRRKHRDRCRQGRCQCGLDGTGPDEYPGAGRARAHHLPASADVDRQQDQPDDPEVCFCLYRLHLHGQVRRLRLRDAAAHFHDGFCQGCAGYRPRSTVEEAGNLEHRRLCCGVRGPGRGHGRGGSFPPVPGLVTIRSSYQRQRPLHVQLPDSALSCRVLHRIRERAKVVLVDHAQQGSAWRPSRRMRSPEPS